jgi:hypothetical protein
MEPIHLFLLLFVAFCLGSVLVQVGRGALALAGCLGACLQDLLQFGTHLLQVKGQHRAAQIQQ